MVVDWWALMPRGWMFIAGGGLLLVSAFASALIVVAELSETGRADPFGLPPVFALIGGVLLLALGIVGVGLGLWLAGNPLGRAAPPPAAAASRAAAPEHQATFMSAEAVAERLQQLQTARAANDAAGPQSLRQPAHVPYASWRTRLTEGSSTSDSARLALPRIQPQPDKSSGDTAE